MSQPESRLSRAIMAGVRARGGFVFKVHGGPTMMNGLPDIVGVIDGRSIWMETKMPDGQPTEIQLHRHKQIVAAGGHLIIPRSVSEAMQWVDGIRHTQMP